MFADPELGVGSGELERPCVVEEQERRQLRPEVGVGEQGPDREAVADPMAGDGAVDGDERLGGACSGHGESLTWLFLNRNGCGGGRSTHAIRVA
jgi:hypothetical protein